MIVLIRETDRTFYFVHMKRS